VRLCLAIRPAVYCHVEYSLSMHHLCWPAACCCSR
jgi:hypothetical protein